MSAAHALAGLVAWWLQAAVFLAAALLLGRLLRSSPPAAVSGYWRAVLVTALAMPLLAGGAPPTGAGQAAVVDVVMTASAGPPGPNAAGWLLALIGTVSMLRLAALARAVRRLDAWGDEGTPYTDHALLADCVRRVGARAWVRLSPAVGLPAAAGWRRPVVLLPTDFAAWREGERRQALVHELLHVRRRDWAAVVVEEAFASMLWFHPGIRWALRELRLARERAVDEETAALTDGRRAYAGTLVALAGRPIGSLPAPALFATRLERRVEALLKEETMSKAKTVSWLAAGTLVLVAVAAVAARAFPLTAQVEGEASGTKKTERAIVTKVQPVYPPDAKKAGIDGKVVLDVLITAAGDVTDVKVESGPEELREASVDAVRQWRYRPAPADTRQELTIRYHLTKKDG